MPLLKFESIDPTRKDGDFVRRLLDEGKVDHGRLLTFQEDYQSGRLFAGDPETKSSNAEIGTFEGFVRKAIHEAGPGLIGLEASEEVKQFEREHPGLSFLASLGGLALPYGAAAKVGIGVSRALPGFARVVKYAEDAQRLRDAPAIAAGAREVARFLPFEAARLGASAAVGDFNQTLQQVGVEVPFLFGTGLLFGKLAGASPLPRPRIIGEEAIRDHFPSYLINETPQFKLEQLNRFLRNNSEEALGDTMNDIQAVRRLLSTEIRKQSPPRGTAYVQKLENGVSASSVNERFRIGETANYRVRNLTSSPKAGLASKEAVQAAIDKILPGGSGRQFEEVIQYPRILTAKTAEGAQSIRDFLLEKFAPVEGGLGNDTFLAKEAEGIWVMAKRIAGEALNPAPNEQWALFKTVHPGLFNPNAERFGSTLVRGAFHHENDALMAQAVANVPIAKFIFQLRKELADRNLAGVSANELTVALESILGPQFKAGSQNLIHGSKYFKQKLKQFIAPSLHEFSESPRAVTAMSIARVAYARAADRAATLFFGREAKTKTKTLFGDIFGGEERFGGIDKLIQRLTDDDLVQVSKAFINNMSISQMRGLGMSSRVTDLFRKLQQVDKRYINEFDSLQELAKETFFKPLENHYMISRTWRGDKRLPIHKMNKDGSLGKLVGYASGVSRAQAKTEADRILQLINTEENAFRVGYDLRELQFVGRDTDLYLAKQIHLDDEAAKAIQRARTRLLDERPLRFKERTGALGYQEILSKKDLRQQIYGNLIESERTLTSTSLKHILFNDISRIRKDAPDIGKNLVNRFNIMAGEKGPVSKQIDEWLDPILGHFMGKGAAGEIARQMNRALFTLTLGAGDMGFAVMNAMTPVQTLLPELAYVMGAAPSRLRGYYTSVPILDGTAIRRMKMLDPVRFMMKGLSDMSRPEPWIREAWDWAKKHKIISPRFIEEFAGQNAKEVQNFSAVLKGEEGILNYLKALSEWAPGKSEEFSRGLSFVTGLRVGKDFFQLEGERLFLFASELTARTNYLYGTGDRARIITGSLGSAFGLFKNWSMHYTANMMSYAGEGLMRGNFAPLLWMLGGTGSLAGVGGVPLYGAANALSRMLSDKSLTTNIYEGFSGDDGKSPLVDSMVYGLPALLGISLQGRAAPAGAEIMRDLDFMFSSAILDRAGALGDALGSAVGHWQTTGQHPINNQAIRDKIVRATLPRVWYRALQFTEDNALKSLQTGNRLISDVTFPAKAKFIFGFTPLDFEKAFEVHGELFRDQAKMKEAVTIFGRTIAEAEKQRDTQTVLDMYKMATIQGIPLDSIDRSVDAFRTKLEEELLDRQFDAYTAFQMRKVMGLK